MSERGDSLMEIFGATLGQVEHRLEQLTNPVFERGMVEVLMKGIKDLLVERASLAMELAEVHNEIDSQAEAIDGYEEELAEDAALIERSTAMIDRLTAENRNLHNQLTMARANLGNGGLKLVPQATAHLRPNSVEAVYRRLHQD